LQAFENGFKSLLDQYSKAAPYLNRALYSDKQCWARAYTFHCFTASAQATSRIESINSQVKDIICRGHITLYEFIKLPNICDTMYQNIDSIFKNFVAPNLIEKIHYEINHSLFYHLAKINPE
ncbi:31754_t:CDS:2, partial [Gigaspora margarita]